MVTLEDVEREWEKFNKYKETAEQHEFPRLLMFDMQFMPLYNDLKKNWDEHHAELFLKGIKVAYGIIGLKNMTSNEQVL